jgi:hypothetical protein
MTPLPWLSRRHAFEEEDKWQLLSSALGMRWHWHDQVGFWRRARPPAGCWRSVIGNAESITYLMSPPDHDVGGVMDPTIIRK